jgi:hypothetical protein
MTTRLKRSLGVATAVTLLSTAVAAYQKPAFPRLGGYLIGSPQNYEDATYRSQIARLDVAILNFWPGWTGYSSSSSSIEQVIGSIKTQHPGEQVFLYMNINEARPSATSGAWASALEQVNANNWWLRSSGASGSMVKSTWGTDYYIINTSAYSLTDSAGERYVDWRAKYQVKIFNAAASSMDGFYTDNVFWRPRVNGDWNLDGAADSSSNATVQSWYRDGFRRYFDALKQLMPGKYQTGNVADWGRGESVLTGYAGQLAGGVMEGMIGYSWSSETWGGWQEMMSEYRKMMGALAEPKLAIFHQNGDPTDYQAFRYGFASCLLDDAYYYFSANDSYHGVNWFDEFDAKLGAAASAPATAAWQHGVYRRDFENGIVLVNPKGNGTQTVTLETSYQRINGTQAPGVNNGQSVSQLTLADRDGIVLLRRTSLKTPDAPPSVSVE